MRSRAAGRRWAAVAVAVALLAAGCTDSGDDDDADVTTTSAETVAESTTLPTTLPPTTESPTTVAETLPPATTLPATTELPETTVETTAPPATDAATSTTVAAPEGPGGPLDRDAAALGDPAVVLPIPQGFELQDFAARGFAAAKPVGGGIAQVYRPQGWTLFEDPAEGSFDLYGDDGYYYGCGGDGGCAEFDPGKGIKAWSPDGTETSWSKDGSVSVDIPTPIPGGGEPDPLDFDDVVDLDNLPPDPNSDEVKFSPNSPSDPGGGGTGEPHYQSADGVWFSTQVAGELMARTGDPGHRLQVRQQPYGDRPVAIITAIGAQVGDHRVGVYATADGADVRIDGVLVTSAAPFTQHDLAGGGAVGVWTESATVATPVDGETLLLRPSVVIVWPDLSIVRATVYSPRGLDVSTEWTTSGVGVSGLLGIPDGDPANDLTGRDGIVADPFVDAEVATFVETWRVLPEESLFVYAPGESTEVFTIPGFPSAPAAIPPEQVAAAEATCRAAGIPDGEQLARCAFDVAITGDQEFAGVHTTLSQYEANAVAAAARIAMLIGISAALRGGLAELVEADRAAAEAVNADETLEIVVAAGESRTMSIVTPPDTRLSLLNEDLSCTEAPAEGEAAYQLFDAAGAPLVLPQAVCAEPVFDAFIGAGPFYLRVTGPASGDPVTLHLRFRALLPAS